MTTTTKNIFLVLALPALIITQTAHGMELVTIPKIARKTTTKNNSTTGLQLTNYYSSNKELSLLENKSSCLTLTTTSNQIINYDTAKNLLRLLKNGSSPLMRITNNQTITHNAINTPQDLLLLLAKEKQNTLTIEEKIELWSKLQYFIQEYNQTNAQKAIQNAPTTIQTDVPKIIQTDAPKPIQISKKSTVQKNIKTDIPTTVKKNMPTATYVPTTTENAFSIFASICNFSKNELSSLVNGYGILTKPNFFL
jgi:hypothetical protein